MVQTQALSLNALVPFVKNKVDQYQLDLYLKGIRHVLVEENNGKVLGILSERDLTTFSQSQDFEKIEAQDIMSTNLLTVTPETRLYEVALEMSKSKFGSTLVMNTDNTYMGIFTATDALNALVEILRGDLEDKD